MWPSSSPPPPLFPDLPLSPPFKELGWTFGVVKVDSVVQLPQVLQNLALAGAPLPESLGVEGLAADAGVLPTQAALELSTTSFEFNSTAVMKWKAVIIIWLHPSFSVLKRG